jgi:hypothetical protein
VSAATAEFDAADLRTAAITRLTGASKDLHVELVSSLAAGGIDVITEGGAAVAEGIGEHLADGGMEALNGRFRQGGGCAPGADSGGEKRFVGVDVADAGEQGLVEKDGLDRRGAALESSSEGYDAETVLQGLRAET